MDSTHFVVRHGDKAVVGAFVVWLGCTVVSMAVSHPAGIEDREKLTADMNRIVTFADNFEPTHEPVPDFASELRRQIDHEKVPSADPFAPWLVHRRPSLVETVVPPRPVPVPVHNAPTNLHTLKIERHRVVLAWTKSEWNDLVKITGYDLMRRTGDGPWVRVASGASDAHELSDESIAARSTVFYRIDERAELDKDVPRIQGLNVTLPASAEVTSNELAVPISTPRDLAIMAMSGAPGNPAGVGKESLGRATLKVFHWRGNADKPLEKTYTLVLEDTPIGKLEPNTPVEGHKTDSVDFTTGAKIVSVTIEKRLLAHSKTEKVSRAIVLIEWPWGEREELESEKLPPELSKQP